MSGMWWFLGLTLLFIVGGAWQQQWMLSEGKALAAKFGALGNLIGKTEAEIIAAVGPPNSRSAMATGQLLQWQRTGYHIALIFDDQGQCGGITHEHLGS